MEINIIQGGIDLIKRTKPFLYLENDLNFIEKSQELIELVFSLGYRIFWHIVPQYNQNNFFENKNNVFNRICACNIFCVRNDKQININLPEVKDSSFHPMKR